jgi:hypothetical protein
MKRWLRRAFIGLGVCLLLALGHPEAGRGVDSRRWIAGGGWSVGRWGEPALSPPPAAPVAWKATPRRAHVAPWESPAVHGVLWTERDAGPPWLDSRGPPGKVRGTWDDSRAAGQTGSLRQGVCILPEGKPSSWIRHHAQEGDFATPFS